MPLPRNSLANYFAKQLQTVITKGCSPIFQLVLLLVLKLDDCTDTFARVHQFETFVDLVERKFVRDHWVDLDLAVHIPVDNFRDVGSPRSAAKSRTTPRAAGDKLEGAG